MNFGTFAYKLANQTLKQPFNWTVGCPAAEYLLKTAFVEELGIAKVESEIILWESKDEQMIFD